MRPPATHSDHRRVSPYWRVFTRTTSPVWVAILLGVAGSAYAPFFFANYFDVPIKDPATGLVFGVPLGHLLVAVLTPAGALATLVFKLGERSARERELEQKDEENFSLRRGVDREGVNQALTDFHHWALLTLDPNHTRVAWRMIVSLAQSAPEVGIQAVDLAWERISALLREGCPLGCEQRDFHIHDVGPWLLAAPVDSLRTLLRLPRMLEQAHEMRLPSDLIPVRLPQVLDLDLGPAHVLDLGRLIMVADREFELRIHGAPGAQVVLPQVPLGTRLRVQVTGSVKLEGASVDGTLHLSALGSCPPEETRFVELSIKGVSDTGTVAVSTEGKSVSWNASLGAVAGTCVVDLLSPRSTRFQLGADLIRSVGGTITLTGSLFDVSSVELRLKDVDSDYSLGSSGLVIESLSVAESSRVDIFHELASAGAAYRGIVVGDSSVFAAHVAFPPGTISGEIIASDVELSGVARRGVRGLDNSAPRFEICFTSENTFGGESLRIRNLRAEGGCIRVVGPVDAGSAGMPIPSLVTLDGTGDGTLWVEATAPGHTEDGKGGKRSTEACTEVLFVGELDALTIDEQSTGVNLERTRRRVAS